MEVCAEHDIAYEGKECPACLIAQDRDAFDNQIGELEKELQSEKNYITKLENKIENLKQEIIDLKHQLE